MRKLIWIALAAALFALAGCGSDDEAEAPTKAVFIKEADQICLQADKKQSSALEKLAKEQPIAKLSPEEQLNLAVELGLPPLKEQAEEIGELTPPEGDEDEIEAIVAKMEEGIEKAEANPQLLSSNSGTFKEADELATKYGFKACSESS